MVNKIHESPAAEYYAVLFDGMTILSDGLGSRFESAFEEVVA